MLFGFFRKKNKNVSEEVLELRKVCQETLSIKDKNKDNGEMKKINKIIKELNIVAKEGKSYIVIHDFMTKNLRKKLKEKGLKVKYHCMEQSDDYYTISFR